jgi:hypothetical protein
MLIYYSYGDWLDMRVLGWEELNASLSTLNPGVRDPRCAARCDADGVKTIKRRVVNSYVSITMRFANRPSVPGRSYKDRQLLTASLLCIISFSGIVIITRFTLRGHGRRPVV